MAGLTPTRQEFHRCGHQGAFVATHPARTVGVDAGGLTMAAGALAGDLLFRLILTDSLSTWAVVRHRRCSG